MLLIALAALLRASPSELPADGWNCRNQLEVWCAADGCAAAPPNEFTPMDINASAGHMGRKGRLEVCAYSGCWTARATAVRASGRLLWAADAAPFSTRPDDAMTADVTLLIVEKDGVGFVRVGGLATPLLCVRAASGGRQ